jgi:hypothetical protein
MVCGSTVPVPYLVLSVVQNFRISSGLIFSSPSSDGRKFVNVKKKFQPERFQKLRENGLRFFIFHVILMFNATKKGVWEHGKGACEII